MSLRTMNKWSAGRSPVRRRPPARSTQAPVRGIGKRGSSTMTHGALGQTISPPRLHPKAPHVPKKRAGTLRCFGPWPATAPHLGSTATHSTRHAP
jgi:hypothetical protein